MKTWILPAVLLTAACANQRPIRGEEGAPKAVVLCAPERRADGEFVARRLNETRGYDVLLDVTPLPRQRSALAVYDVRGNPERTREAAEFVEELGPRFAEIEVLPFQQHATGGNALVLWLGSQSLEASSPATSR